MLVWLCFAGLALCAVAACVILWLLYMVVRHG